MQINGNLRGNQAAVPVINNTASTLPAGPVSVVGYSPSTSRYEVGASSGASAAHLFLRSALVSGGLDYGFKVGEFISSLDASGASVGDPVYLDFDGSLTLTMPDPLNVQTQIVGRVKTATASASVASFLGYEAPVGPPAVQALTGLLFGNGSDGDVVISSVSTVTLSRDMYYRTLTIQAGGVLYPNGYKVFCQYALINDGSITANGSPGADYTGGYGSNAGTLGAGQGGYGGYMGEAIAPPSLPPYMAGGAGGLGGSPNTVGGASYVIPTAALGGLEQLHSVFGILWFSVLHSGSVFGGGSGGTGGGGDSLYIVTGAGGGAGVVFLAADSITGAGLVQAKGGAGQDATHDFAGAGGGGGGAAVLISSNDTTETDLMVDVSGGAGGASYYPSPSGGTNPAGGAGAPGNIFRFNTSGA